MNGAVNPVCIFGTSDEEKSFEEELLELENICE